MITMLLDKWRLGPLRLLNFLALAIVTIRFAPALQRTIRWRPLELLGAASLPVFCAHLVAVLFALALVGDKGGTTALLTELTLLAGTFAAMFGAAWAFQSKPRRESTAKPDEEVAVSARAGR
jgi:peptidoglycan/LPS O-acetylase OafA/YrhL